MDIAESICSSRLDIKIDNLICCVEDDKNSLEFSGGSGANIDMPKGIETRIAHSFDISSPFFRK